MTVPRIRRLFTPFPAGLYIILITRAGGRCRFAGAAKRLCSFQGLFSGPRPASRPAPPHPRGAGVARLYASVRVRHLACVASCVGILPCPLSLEEGKCVLADGSLVLTLLVAVQSETEDMLFIDSAGGARGDLKGEAEVRPGTSVNFALR